MTDVGDNLTMATPVIQTPSSEENILKQELSDGQVSNESEAFPTSTNPFVATEEASKGEEESTDTDYSINCPEYVSQEEVTAHIEAFKEAGIDAKTAQKVVDRLVAHGETNEKRSIERLDKALAEDKTALKSEFGADYSGREKDIARYLRDVNMSGEDIGSLVSIWGFEKTFKFFDRYAQMNKESSVGDTFAKQEGSQGIQEDYDKSFNDPEFIKKRRTGGADANKTIRDWALQQATLNQ